MPKEIKKENGNGKNGSEKKASVTLPGTVEKIIPPLAPSEPEKAQIALEGADDLYREIRVVNKLKNPKGKDVKLKQGDEVDVTIEAESTSTTTNENRK